MSRELINDVTHRLGTVTGHDMNAPSTSHSVGELHANYEGKVTDNNDPNRIVDRGTVGDIWIRGPGCSPGYYQNPEATNDAHGADGWFSTGDVGYVDNEGQWYIVDRKKVTHPGATNISNSD